VEARFGRTISMTTYDDDEARWPFFILAKLRKLPLASPQSTSDNDGFSRPRCQRHDHLRLRGAAACGWMRSRAAAIALPASSGRPVPYVPDAFSPFDLPWSAGRGSVGGCKRLLRRGAWHPRVGRHLHRPSRGERLRLDDAEPNCFQPHRVMVMAYAAFRLVVVAASTCADAAPGPGVLGNSMIVGGLLVLAGTADVTHGKCQPF
jgi:hypothetical protein